MRHHYTYSCSRGLRPEVEILGHVDLLEDVHESLLFRRLVYPVVVCHRHNVRTLAVIDVVSTNKSNDRSFGDKDHVPPSGELDETWMRTWQEPYGSQTSAQGRCAVFDIPATPKNTLALPSPPVALFPSSNILSIAVICLPL